MKLNKTIIPLVTIATVSNAIVLPDLHEIHEQELIEQKKHDDKIHNEHIIHDQMINNENQIKHDNELRKQKEKDNENLRKQKENDLKINNNNEKIHNEELIEHKKFDDKIHNDNKILEQNKLKDHENDIEKRKDEQHDAKKHDKKHDEHHDAKKEHDKKHNKKHHEKNVEKKHDKKHHEERHDKKHHDNQHHEEHHDKKGHHEKHPGKKDHKKERQEKHPDKKDHREKHHDEKEHHERHPDKKDHKKERHEKYPEKKEHKKDHHEKHSEHHDIMKSKAKTHETKLAPLFTASNSNKKFEDLIPHRYIIVFKDSISSDEINFHKETIQQIQLESVETLPENDPFFASTNDLEFSKNVNGGIQDSFDIENLINGYVGYFTDEVIDFIRLNPLVKFVEQDSIVKASEFDTQNGATWGLARISHRDRLNLGSFNKYLYDDDAGKGVTAYVIDTGINVNHKEFEGRAHWGSTIPLNDEDLDGNGHGTHCAGTIASKHYGVAKNAEVVAVKVLRSNGSGSMSDVVKGVEYAAKSHIEAAKENKKGFKGSTANMSLGGGKSPALDLAVNAAVKAGLHFAVAAGNENQDACNTSPASAENAVTVGASTLSDDRAYFSNWGSCVDIFAPGLNILSTYIGSDEEIATLSGTSMASPHVAGLLAYFLSLQPDSDSEFFQAKGGITPAQLKKRLIAYGSRDILFDVPEDTPNVLIYNGGGQDLSDFWNNKSIEEQEMGITEEIYENLNTAGNVLYEQVAGIFQKMDLF